MNVQLGTHEREWSAAGTIRRQFRPEPLLGWAEHVRGEVVRALKVLPGVFDNAKQFGPRQHPLLAWFSADKESHPFDVPVQEWLTLTETQVMTGLAYFTNKLGPKAFQAMFETFSSGFSRKSEECRETNCRVEVQAEPSIFRIDMVVSAQSKTGYSTIVVEAKLGSTLARNPLPVYKQFAKAELGHCNRKMAKSHCAHHDEFDFVILDFSTSSKTTKRLNRNTDWRLLSWHAFMSRLERLLSQHGVTDPDYQNFRRQVWKRI